MSSIHFLYYYKSVGLVTLSDKFVKCKEIETSPFYYNIIQLTSAEFYQIYSIPGGETGFIRPELKYDLLLEPYEGVLERYKIIDRKLVLVYRTFNLTSSNVNRYNYLLKVYLHYNILYNTTDLTLIPSFNSISNYHPSSFKITGSPYSFSNNSNLQIFTQEQISRIVDNIRYSYEFSVYFYTRYTTMFGFTEFLNGDRLEFDEDTTKYLDIILKLDGLYPDEYLKYYLLSDKPLPDNRDSGDLGYYRVKTGNLDFDCAENYCARLKEITRPFINVSRLSSFTKQFIRRLQGDDLLMEFFLDLTELTEENFDISRDDRNPISQIYNSMLDVKQTALKKVLRKMLKEAIQRGETLCVPFENLSDADILIIARMHNLDKDTPIKDVCKILNKKLITSIERVTIRSKLKSWMDTRWDYEIKCDVFEEIDEEALNKLARLYNIDESLSRIQICSKLSEILEEKRKIYTETIKEKSCSNNTDLLGNDVSDIDYRRLITLEQLGQTYCFDIDDIYKNMFVQKNTKNPYTNIPFSEKQQKDVKEKYKIFKTLRGDKFDEDIYIGETKLRPIVSQLFDRLGFAPNQEKLMVEDEKFFNIFLKSLDNYGIRLKLNLTSNHLQNKIHVIQKLIKWGDKNNLIIIGQAWIYTLLVDALVRRSLSDLARIKKTAKFEDLEIVIVAIDENILPENIGEIGVDRDKVLEIAKRKRISQYYINLIENTK